MILSIGVFGWSAAKLIETVNALEKEGHHVTGYEAGKLSGYDYIEHDRLVFVDYAPDLLSMWKDKASKLGRPCNGEVVMPSAPRSFGDPASPAKTDEIPRMARRLKSPEPESE